MSSTYKTVGGMDVALNVPDHQAYLSIARWYHVPGWIKRYSGDKVVSGNDLGWIPPNDAMCMAIRSLFTPDEFKLNPWSEEHIAAFTGIVDKRHTEIAVMGPAAATKSETFGLLLDLHYFTSPFDTTCRLISTDLKGLKQRSWNSVTKYYSILKKEGATAVFSRQTLAILNADDDDENIASAIQKAGIFAYALKSATLEEGISKCVGTHWPFGSVVLLADEAQQVNPHFYEGLSNLFIGTEDVRLISLGNPMRLMDALSDRAEPEHGWGSVTVEDHEWCSRRDALVIHFDGEKSPALVEPDEYPFLINQKGIDAVLRENHGRKTSNGYMSMVRGWWSTGDGADLLITMSYIKKFNAMDQVEWSISPEFVVAGFDPGYGGDDAILQLADVGLFSNGIYGIAFRDPIIIDIDTSSDVPVQYQMSSQIDAVRRKQPFQLTRMAADESGLQRTSDVVEMEAREQGIIRVNFSARASYNLVSLYDNTPAFEKYGNFVTEIWARLADLIQFGQVRNLPEQVAKELSMRILLPKRPLRLESKLDLKKRLKRSPDNADAATLTSYAAIESGALNPGASIYHRQGGIFTSVHKPNFPTTDYSEHDFSEPEVFN